VAIGASVADFDVGESLARVLGLVETGVAQRDPQLEARVLEKRVAVVPMRREQSFFVEWEAVLDAVDVRAERSGLLPCAFWVCL
jgi:hypothetical protein